MSTLNRCRLASTVHPHARGDNEETCGQGRRHDGSPPRAWGQCNDDPRYPGGQRFTPTRVGTMSKGKPPYFQYSVHPHARGDNLIASTRGRWIIGSPPRAWGQCAYSGYEVPHHRFTPKRVGTMGGPSRICSGAPVHPHARGDNSRMARAQDATSGSPPRAWGQCLLAALWTALHRFTPTRVGTMPPMRIARIRTAVHPHARGDNSAAVAMREIIVGSPPRAWGQWISASQPRGGHRFTPTRVGTIRRSASARSSTTVHPHARGDNGRYDFRREVALGSPPRAWGQSRPAHRRPALLRFTPTRVGTMRG